MSKTKQEVPVCTPVLWWSGERLRIENPEYGDNFDHTRGPGPKGIVTDPRSGQRYVLFGKPCDIDTCQCDAWAVEIES